MLNNVTLVGRLTRDPELKYTPNGVAVTSMTLAVNRPFKSQNGENETDFINIQVWRKQAENAANYLKKGSLTGVTGRITTRNYENAEGKKVYVTEVTADSVQFLESKGKGENKPPQKKAENNNDPFANDGQPININDDDLPF